MTSPEPVQPHERNPLLDAIRGMALGGILLANMMSFLMLGAPRSFFLILQKAF